MKKTKKRVGETYTVETQKINGESKVLTFSINDIRRSNRYTDEEKVKIIDVVCHAKENGVSIEKICEKLGISEMSFFRWVNPDSPYSFGYGVKKYDELKKRMAFSLSETMIETAFNSLIAKTKRRTLTTTTKYYAVNKDGEMELKGLSETTKTVEADTNAINFLLRNLSPQFSDDKRKTEIDSTDYELVDTADLMQMLKDESIVDDMFKVDSDINKNV